MNSCTAQWSVLTSPIALRPTIKARLLLDCDLFSTSIGRGAALGGTFLRCQFLSCEAQNVSGNRSATVTRDPVGNKHPTVCFSSVITVVSLNQLFLVSYHVPSPSKPVDGGVSRRQRRRRLVTARRVRPQGPALPQDRRCQGGRVPAGPGAPAGHFH